MRFCGCLVHNCFPNSRFGFAQDLFLQFPTSTHGISFPNSPHDHQVGCRDRPRSYSNLVGPYPKMPILTTNTNLTDPIDSSKHYLHGCSLKWTFKLPIDKVLRIQSNPQSDQLVFWTSLYANQLNQRTCELDLEKLLYGLGAQ